MALRPRRTSSLQLATFTWNAMCRQVSMISGGMLSRLAGMIMQRAAPAATDCAVACSTSGRIQASTSVSMFQLQHQAFRHASKASTAAAPDVRQHEHLSIPGNPETLKTVTQPRTIAERLAAIKESKSLKAVENSLAGMDLIPSQLVASAFAATSVPSIISNAGRTLPILSNRLQASMDVLLHTYTHTELVDCICGLAAHTATLQAAQNQLISRAVVILLDHGASLLMAAGPDASVRVAEALAQAQHSNDEQWAAVAGVVAKQASGNKQLQSRAAAALNWAVSKFPDATRIKSSAEALMK